MSPPSLALVLPVGGRRREVCGDVGTDGQLKHWLFCSLGMPSPGQHHPRKAQ